VAEDVQKLVESAGGDFTKFQRWLIESGWATNGDSFGSYDEVPMAILGRVLKASKTFVKQMQAL
jgi:endonuclease YncB( thermonuclease family)